MPMQFVNHEYLCLYGNSTRDSGNAPSVTKVSETEGGGKEMMQMGHVRYCPANPMGYRMSNSLQRASKSLRSANAFGSSSCRPAVDSASAS